MVIVKFEGCGFGQCGIVLGMFFVFLDYVVYVIGEVLGWLVIGIQCEMFVIQGGVGIVEVWLVLVVGVGGGIEFVWMFVFVVYVVVEQLVGNDVFFYVFDLFVLQCVDVGFVFVVVVIGQYVFV